MCPALHHEVVDAHKMAYAPGRVLVTTVFRDMSADSALTPGLPAAFVAELPVVWF